MTISKTRPLDGLRSPGNLPVTSGVMHPVVASMPTRPCLTSVERRLSTAAASPFLLRPAGHQARARTLEPNVLSKPRSGGAGSSAQSPQALPMIASMPSRPFAIPTLSLRCLPPGSAVYKLKGLHPSSPGSLSRSALCLNEPDSQ